MKVHIYGNLGVPNKYPLILGLVHLIVEFKLRLEFNLFLKQTNKHKQIFFFFFFLLEFKLATRFIYGQCPLLIDYTRKVHQKILLS